MNQWAVFRGSICSFYLKSRACHWVMGPLFPVLCLPMVGGEFLPLTSPVMWPHTMVRARFPLL